MAGLEDHLDGVESVSPTDEDLDNLPLEPNDDDTEDLSADSGDGAGGGGDEEKGRTPENVYREVSRKLEKQEEKNQAFQERMMGLMERMSENLAKPAETAEPDNANGDALSKYSVAQLKDMRAQVPDEKREAYDEYIVERMVQDKIETGMSAAEQVRNANDTRKQVAQKAVDLFPDLLDKSTDFAAAVDKELRYRGKGYAENNPHALLDVASTIATRMGIGRRSTPPNPRTPTGGHATRRNAAPKGGSKNDELTLSRERAGELASSLQGALPKGKKFDIEKIRKNSQEYSDNADLFIR